jgi:DegV family protein with EDD domain
MKHIRIVTDSTADIPLQERQELGIEMVPLKIHIDHETFLDAVTLQAEDFYTRLPEAKALPTTSQPSPAEFMELYQRMTEEDPDVHIISIHVSSLLSGTYQSALLAKSMLEDNVNLTVVDSKSASYGIGVMVVAAAKAAREGKSAEACIEIAEWTGRNCSVFFLVDTLEYLQKGGRIGKASAFFGTLLNIKPILTLDPDGIVTPLDKVRGQKKAMNRIVELMHEKLQPGPIDLVLAHANSRESLDQLYALIAQDFEIRSLKFVDVGPVVGTHAGPGTIAVFITPAFVPDHG